MTKIENLTKCWSCMKSYKLLIPIFKQDIIYTDIGDEEIYEREEYICFECLREEADAT